MSETPINKLPVKILIEKLLSGLHSQSVRVLQGESNPIQLDHQGIIYNIYIRNVSHAGKSYPENSTRSQLPKHSAFDRIKESCERFLFLGYANDSDVFVCWDPVKAKSRLNKKEYVSFFSRKSVQDAAEEGEIKKATLSNGDVFVAFKRSDFEAFLTVIEHLFPNLNSKNGKEEAERNEEEMPSLPTHKNKTPKSDDGIGLISKIENDSSLHLLVDSLINDGHSIISISAHVMNNYSANYPNMQFKDWAKIIRSYLHI